MYKSEIEKLLLVGSKAEMLCHWNFQSPLHPMAAQDTQTKKEIQPKGFVEDIVAAIFNPGYIGGASLGVINVALVLVAILIFVRVSTDARGITDLENGIHLFALIPCVGLLISINWYAHMVASIKKAEALEQTGQQETKPTKSQKKKAD